MFTGTKVSELHCRCIHWEQSFHNQLFPNFDQLWFLQWSLSDAVRNILKGLRELHLLVSMRINICNAIGDYIGPVISW